MRALAILVDNTSLAGFTSAGRTMPVKRINSSPLLRVSHFSLGSPGFGSVTPDHGHRDIAIELCFDWLAHHLEFGSGTTSSWRRRRQGHRRPPRPDRIQLIVDSRSMVVLNLVALVFSRKITVIMSPMAQALASGTGRCSYWHEINCRPVPLFARASQG